MNIYYFGFIGIHHIYSLHSNFRNLRNPHFSCTCNIGNLIEILKPNLVYEDINSTNYMDIFDNLWKQMVIYIKKYLFLLLDCFSIFKKSIMVVR